MITEIVNKSADEPNFSGREEESETITQTVTVYRSASWFRLTHRRAAANQHFHYLLIC